MPVTTVKSADGLVTVEIPDGALPDGATVTIESRPGDQAAPELKAAGVSPPHWELLPSGTKFSEPVKVTVTYPHTAKSSLDGISFPLLTVRNDDGKWEWLGDAEVRITPQGVISSGTTDHFSSLYPWSDRTDVIIDPAFPRTDEVGKSFTRRIEAKSKDVRTHEINFTNVTFYNYAQDVIAVGEDKTGTPSAPKTIINRDWTCVGPGSYGVEFWAAINEFGTDNPFFPNTLGVSKHTGVIKIELPGTCVTDLPDVQIEKQCIQTVHSAFGTFLSYLFWSVFFAVGDDIDFIEIVLQGANDDKPAELRADGNGWTGKLGLRNAGIKKLLSFKIHYKDGTVIDATPQAIADLGSDTIDVPPPPDQPLFGNCDGVPPPGD